MFADSVNVNDVKESVAYLKQMNFSNKDILSRPTTILLHRKTLSNRRKVLEECCFREVKIRFLQQFVKLMNHRINIFKTNGHIDSNANVQENLVKLLNIDVGLTSEIGDEISFNALREIIIHHFLKVKLGVTDQDLRSMPKTHQNRLKHRSLNSIVKVVDLLQNKLKISPERIMKNLFLLYSCPDNINEILIEVPKIADVPIEKILSMRPKIALSNAEAIKSIIKHVKSFGIPEDRLLKSLELFTLSSNTVYERLQELTRIEEFSVLRSHTRILRLIHYQRKAKIRLDYFKQLNVKCVSLNVLASNSETFEKYARDGADKTNGRDTVLYVAETLNKDQSWVKQIISRHPNWCHVPAVAVKESIEYLRSKGFTCNEISDNLHLLLYPVPRIEQNLNPLLQNRAGNDDSHQIAGVALSKISNQKLLSICMYYIEAEFHFSGDGIWDSIKHDHKQDILPNVIPEFPKTLIKDYRYGLNERKRQTSVTN